MKIRNLKINGFGKLKENTIDFKDGINIIYGENESGKSTILKFIIAMFYGLSKNKNGGIVPDTEKYEPWKSEEFSGKILYELDNSERYEVYRDFKKKSPKIFNSNLEDISKQFTIDKNKGNRFFYDQTGLEEEIFTSSIITKQAEVKLDEKTQNSLIQKISNILGTGEDTTSYESIVSKLKKKINDEVGTANTKERPINVIEDRIQQLEKSQKELINYEKYKFDIDSKITTLKDEIEKENLHLESLRKANIKKEELKEQENIIKINKNIVKDIEEDIDKLKDEEVKYKKQKGSKFFKYAIPITLLVIIITLALILIIDKLVYRIIILSISLVYLMVIIGKYNENKKKDLKITMKSKEIVGKIKILESNMSQKQQEIKKLEIEYTDSLKKIQKENNIIDLEHILENIDNKQNEISKNTILLHTLEIDKNNILQKLERAVNIEEELESLKEDKVHLELKRENIKRTLEYIKIAYTKMKEQITPKFTEELSNVINKISGNKYKNVRINTNGEIIVEDNNGDYINAESLSIGTIDQLYLSLRLATAKEITNENMPIILDEAFAYYDEDRLENILKYLSEEYENKQIIIFTCTKRERDILEKMKISYNLVEL